MDPGAVYSEVRQRIRAGDLDIALAQADKAFLRWSSKDQAWAWRFRIEKAHILILRGSTKAAVELLSASVPANLASSDVAVHQQMYLALAHDFSQEFELAQKNVAAAEELARAAQPDLVGDVAQVAGIIFFDQKKYEQARAAFRRSFDTAVLRKDPFAQVNALGSLGNVSMAQEHYDEAVDRFTSALRLSQQLGATFSEAKAFGNLGWSYKGLGDFDNALASYRRAEEISARGGVTGDRLYWLTGISNIYYQQHDYAAAERVLLQALDLARKQDDKTIPIEYLNDLTEIALQTERVDAAEKSFAEATALEKSSESPAGVQESMLLRGRIAEAKANLAEAEKCFQRLIRDPHADSAQRWEAHAHLARVYSGQGQRGEAEREFRASLETIETVRSSVQAEDLRLSFLSSGIDFYNDYIEFLIAQQRSEEALQVAELSRARTLAEGLNAAPKAISFSPRNFHPQQIARRLSATLLFYWLGEKHSYLWVITPAKVVPLTLPAAGAIAPVVKSYREALISGRDVLASGNADGAKLYSLLIEPAKKLIPTNSRVILLPDGSLYGLNFEALIAPEPKPHFWIEDVTLSTASSLTLLSSGTLASAGAPGSALRSRERASVFAGGAGRLLLVGNAISANGDFPPLQQAAAEIDRVAHYFDAARREILAGPQATAAAFLEREPGRFAFLHFVTHGTASRAHPLDSAVILSPDAADGGSFKLYARDIVKHPLSADLVTISACSGSGTRAYSGEGLVGLSWAFLRAGAHNVIAALWEVNDASTPQLMDAMYAELARGRSPADALRAAKLTLLHSESVFRKPFYWAPFQLYSGS